MHTFAMDMYILNNTITVLLTIIFIRIIELSMME